MSRRLPNILITMCDDQRHSALGCCDDPTADAVRTPFLDRLAARGRRFTHAYHAGSPSGAICAPSRAMLHSGRGPFSIPRGMAGHSLGEAYDSNEAAPLLGELLDQAGYRTHFVGKWHNDEASLHRSFQSAEAVFHGGMSDHFNLPTTRFGSLPKKFPSLNTHSTDVFAAAARAFLRHHADTEPDRPFFLVVAFTAPHDPRKTHAQWHERYPHTGIELPPNAYAEHPFDNGELDVRDELITPLPRDSSQTRREIADYYAMIEHVDHGIGRIHDMLDQLGLVDDTLTVHTADHGLAVGQHGLLGKQNLYDHSVRVPLIVAGPDIVQGVTRTPVYQHDLYPTLLDAVGLDTQGSPFTSLSPRLAGADDEHRFIGCYYQRAQRMVTDGRNKLMRIIGPDGPIERRFDLVADPFETNPLDTPATDRERHALATWMQQHGDPDAHAFAAAFDDDTAQPHH